MGHFRICLRSCFLGPEEPSIFTTSLATEVDCHRREGAFYVSAADARKRGVEPWKTL
jgi:hypothetical protein